MQAVGGAGRDNNEYWIWGDHSLPGAVKAVAVSSLGVTLLSILSNFAYDMFSDSDDVAVDFVTIGAAVAGTAISVAATRAFAKIETLEREVDRRIMRVVAGVLGGAALTHTLADTLSIVYRGEEMSALGQGGFAGLGLFGGIFLGALTKSWGLAVFNVGLSTITAQKVGIGASFAVKNYLPRVPIPTTLAFFSLFGHPYVPEQEPKAAREWVQIS